MESVGHCTKAGWGEGQAPLAGVSLGSDLFTFQCVH